MTDDRRHFRRLRAPALWRVASVGSALRPVDVSLGGMRIFSDDLLKIGQRLEIELLVADGDALQFTTRVVWIETLPPGGHARYDVGLEFLHVEDGVRAHLQNLLHE